MFTWTPEMIRLMQNANARSEYHRQLAAILANILTPAQYGAQALRLPHALRRGVRAGKPLGSAEPVF